MPSPSGTQHRIEHGGLSATITEVGATLRELSLNGAPVIWSFSEDQICSGGRGQVLAPWPNRLADGSYVYRGSVAQAALNEPERHNAIHGLVRWLNWRVSYEERALVELVCDLPPQPAYPFRLQLSIAYELGDEGLRVRTRAETDDRRTAPFGIGFHPYFLAGSPGLSGCRLEVDASRHLELDERGLPIGDEALDGALGQLRSPGGADLKEMVLDDCFFGLSRDEDQMATVRLFPGEGPIEEVTLRLDSNFDYLMCFTGDTLAPADRRRAVAIEPMTCPPNALQSGTSLIEIAPEQAFEANFEILPKAAS